jgi:hypothetical protein
VGITLTGHDHDEETLTFEIISDPLNGTLTVSPLCLTYSPTATFTGIDRFTFVARNRSGSSIAANIDIYVIDPGNYLKNLNVDFAPYNSGTNRAGAFFSGQTRRKCFVNSAKAFSATTKAIRRDNPAFEYRIALYANVYSPINATVSSVTYQDGSEDFEIHLVPVDINDMWISIDHVRNPTVVADDIVTAGQVLGNPGTWDIYVGRVEIQIILTMEGESFCFFLYCDPATRAGYENKVTQLIEIGKLISTIPKFTVKKNFQFQDAERQPRGCDSLLFDIMTKYNFMTIRPSRRLIVSFILLISGAIFLLMAHWRTPNTGFQQQDFMLKQARHPLVVHGFQFTGFHGGEKNIFIRAGRHSIEKKKFGLFSSGLLRIAKFKGAEIDIYIKQVEPKKNNDQDSPEPNYSLKGAFTKETMPAADLKNVVSFLFEPVKVHFYSGESLITQIQANRASIILKEST